MKNEAERRERGVVEETGEDRKVRREKNEEGSREKREGDDRRDRR